MCSFLEHHASVAARGALRVLLNERAASARGGAGSGARTRSARALATRLLRMVRGATTSATLVRARLRDVEEAMRHASTSGAPRDGQVWSLGAIFFALCFSRQPFEEVEDLVVPPPGAAPGIARAPSVGCKHPVD